MALTAFIAGQQRLDPLPLHISQHLMPRGAGSAHGTSLDQKSPHIWETCQDGAVGDKLIIRNLFERIKLPKQGQGMSLATAQLHALADAMPSIQDRVLTFVLGYCGLRWGEAVGLTVGAVDWERRRLNVTRAYAEAGGAL